MKLAAVPVRSCLGALVVAGCCLAWAAGDPAAGDSPTATVDRAASDAAALHSPAALAVSPDGHTIYAVDATGAALVALDAAKGTIAASIALNGNPQSVALSADGRTAYVGEYGAGTVAVVDVAAKSVATRIAVGRFPAALALAEKERRLYVADQEDHCVRVIDLAAAPQACVARIEVRREPVSLAVTPDERRVVVANLLPVGVGTDPKLAAEVSVIDAEKLAVVGHAKLPPGSSCVRGVCVSPDGKWAYVVHGLGRFNLPITQLERGWVNTFALSVVDIASPGRVATMLLDDLTQGAAALEHYRQRGTFEDRLGEFQQAIRPRLSHDEFAANEALLRLSLLAFDLASMLRLEYEDAAGSCVDLGRFQRDVLKAGGRVVKQARRLVLRVARAVTPFWRLLVDRLRRWSLPRRLGILTGPQLRAWMPPPRHAFLREVRRE